MKFQILALLLVSTFSAIYGSEIKDDSIKETIISVFNSILNVTGVILDDANDLVDEIDENQEQITADIIAFVIQLGKDFNVIFIDGIDQLRDEASPDAVHAIDCIDAERNKTEAAFAEVSTIVGQCAATEIDVTLVQFRTILDQLSLLQEDVRKEVDNLSSCTLSDTVCLYNFVTEATVTIGKVEEAVKEDIVDIVNLINKVIQDFESCPITDTILARTQEIFNEGVICIMED
ncbi:uncharacterized protein [Euwallacea similis]|uniref:uncharacterized protein n=1 Tax=Euwallacea similis TaxID=1736056 RepID=UPI00344DF75C